MDELFKTLGINPASVQYDVHIVSACEIRELNKQYRAKDKSTDVLSFPMLDLRAGEIPTPEKFPFDIDPESGKIMLGDIVVNETEKNHPELIRHGLLHLLGYHHDDDKDDH